MHQNAKVQFNI